ncbi:TlpA family protein disulfide reductase [Maribacter polysaccharolyticus]|uniref:TlpA family protein disulfide reductase n=1 Tax=Maribacter polysaccharolyticus TaxID=3020831 RepID=UPI00237FC29F|nr:transaldolase [Maribacter polysaccharolyticus]MDE3740617.1 transaldolase [Maribacter polysaccharolyticus]
MNRSLLILLLSVLVGCSEDHKNSSSVFFSGEIVNPTDNYVVLFKGDKLIDSVALDDDNRFAFRFDSIENGLYHFKHAPEYQNVYLNRGDSLFIRLNTVDFDESLVYSGKGEEINNFMMEVYLTKENEKKIINDFYRLEPKGFSRKIDSLQHLKLDLLNELNLDFPFTEKEMEIAKADIVYNYAKYKERYPFKHKKFSKTKNKIPDLDKSYYAYRNEITYDNKDLTYLRPYYEFMVNHFGNLSFMSCTEGCEIKDNMARNHLHFNKHKMKLIDSMVVEKDLKDNLFRNVAVDYLLKVHDTPENNRIFMEVFQALSSDNKHMAEIEDLYNGIKNIQPQNRIPEIEVTNFNGEKITLPNIAKNRKTVFYFWSGTNRKHLNNISNRVKQLEREEPNFDFVGINVKTGQDEWKSLVKTSGFDASSQFRSDNFEQLTKSLIVYPLNKCIITEDEQIVDAFGDIYKSFD